jgi:hypothetical protein
MAASMEQSLAMATVPWKATTKIIFLRGMIETDAHDLPLANPALNFIRNKL